MYGLVHEKWVCNTELNIYIPVPAVKAKNISLKGPVPAFVTPATCARYSVNGFNPCSTWTVL